VQRVLFVIENPLAFTWVPYFWGTRFSEWPGSVPTLAQPALLAAVVLRAAIGFPARATRRILATAGLGGPMTMTEVEKSSRSILERTFYTKLGPTPAFPPSRTETGQVKPVQR
jgi:hypothetical protein